jgi:hypothetical protein
MGILGQDDTENKNGKTQGREKANSTVKIYFYESSTTEKT